MDIWSWVWDMQQKLEENGQNSLANALLKLPQDTVDGNHQQVDQYIDEIVAEARQAGNSWVELFLRHWYLQSKILHRGEPKDAIKEAVSLLEFAHSEENKDCPQSICAVQDLASCYGQFDGAGYSEQRIAVAKEGLEKINTSWPCYKCVSAEYAEALRDASRYEECLIFLEKVDNDYVQDGYSKDTSNLLLVKTNVLMRQGKYDEARKQGKKLDSWGGGSNFEMDAITLRALIEAHDGNHQEALKFLPGIDKILKENSSLIGEWSEAMVLIMAALKEQQTNDNIQRLLSLADTMHQRGTYRQAFDSYARIMSLVPVLPEAIDTKTILNTMQQIQTRFNQDCGATETLEKLQQSYAS